MRDGSYVCLNKAKINNGDVLNLVLLRSFKFFDFIIDLVPTLIQNSKSQIEPKDSMDDYKRVTDLL